MYIIVFFAERKKSIFYIFYEKRKIDVLLNGKHLITIVYRIKMNTVNTMNRYFMKLEKHNNALKIMKPIPSSYNTIYETWSLKAECEVIFCRRSRKKIRNVLIKRPQHIRAPTFRSTKRCFCTMNTMNSHISDLNHTCDNMDGHLGFICPLFIQQFYSGFEPRRVNDVSQRYYNMIHYIHNHSNKENRIYCNTCIYMKLMHKKKGE